MIFLDIDRGDNTSIIDRGDNTSIIDRGDNTSIIDRGDNTSTDISPLSIELNLTLLSGEIS